LAKVDLVVVISREHEVHTSALVKEAAPSQQQLLSSFSDSSSSASGLTPKSRAAAPTIFRRYTTGQGRHLANKASEADSFATANQTSDLFDFRTYCQTNLTEN
jgi:hypothetical protein